MQEIYSQLMELFYEYQPNDECFLEGSPELVDEMEAIENLDTSTDEGMQNAITTLCDFMEEWFPDSVSESEQKRIRRIIDKGYNAIKKSEEVICLKG